MVSNKLTILYVLIIVGLYFGLLSPNIDPNYIPVVYSQALNSSFEAEVDRMDNMPTQRVEVGDIDIAYKQLGNESSIEIPIVLIAGGGVTMDM
jgi:hypothetical protein